MPFNISIIHGPNLNLLGSRETSIYGVTRFEEILNELKKTFQDFEIDFFQSNLEGEIVNYIQSCIDSADGIIINPAAYTHTSIAIRDALALVKCPIIEVHISNIDQREEFRKKSTIRDLTWSHVQGFGVKGYEIALSRLQEFLSAT
ncbi:MAG: type II 3-dehydroquinate dehydratase [Bacteroidota bacterium]|nr:type II 3-dehydroquinate dehydratase [Bacteroidota bacterium]